MWVPADLKYWAVLDRFHVKKLCNESNMERFVGVVSDVSRMKQLRNRYTQRDEGSHGAVEV